MKVFGIGEYSRIKEIASYQVEEWACGIIFGLFGLPKMIVVDADGLFLECTRRLSKRPY